jgi:hypothetical protein
LNCSEVNFLYLLGLEGSEDAFFAEAEGEPDAAEEATPDNTETSQDDAKFRQNLKDILEDQKLPESEQKWHKIDERPDPFQPKDMESRRELWQNEETGEQIQKHVLEKNGVPANERHPHFQPPKGWSRK